MKLSRLILILFLLPARAIGEDVIFRNQVFDEEIGNIMLHKQKEPENPLPYIVLNSGEQLRLAFDLLSTSGEFFQYSLVHCDAYWKQSNLQPLQYMSGSLQGQISTFTSSRNALQKYVHYESLVPATDMKLRFSGNYILKVFRNFDEEELVFTRRLLVLDQKFTLITTARSATKANYRMTRQEVDFTVGYKGYTIVNPNNDVKAVILQNHFWDNAVILRKPYNFTATELNFNFEEENTFEGTNEFRFFDTRSLRFFSQNVERKYIDSITQAVMKPDELRSDKPYLQYPDFNGRAVMANRDGSDINTDGDYAWHYFSVKSDKLDGDVYITGQLSDFQLEERCKMTYDPKEKAYQVAIKLKQGYYNYQYALVTPDSKVSYAPIEGSFSDAENDYTILVYCKNMQFGYDELLGIDAKNSRKP